MSINLIIFYLIAVASTSHLDGSAINQRPMSLSNHVKLSVSEQHLTDDGIGTSDDETGSNSSSRSSTRQNNTNGNDNSEGLNSMVDSKDYEENASQISSSGSTGIEEDEERNELAIEDDDKINFGGPNCASRRVIKLDMSKLLAFDEVLIFCCISKLIMHYMYIDTIYSE